MLKIPLAPYHYERIEWDSNDPEAKGRFAYKKGRAITYYPRWWVRLIWPYIYPMIEAHERGHSWGIRRCLGNHSYCLMAEETEGVDSFWGKAKMWPTQIWHGLDFCDECKRYLKEKIDA